MLQLTKYNSYEALKASKNQNNTNERLRAERNAALEHFIEQLRNSINEKKRTLKLTDTDERGIS